MSEIICEFSEPVNLGTPELPDYEYSELNCQYSTSTIQEVGTTLISDGENSFYFSPKLTSGDVILIFFLIVFLGVIIFKTLWNFVHTALVKMKTREL